MPRLFVALRPPPEMRQALLSTMHGIAGARWQSDAQLHLTLAFVGDADASLAERIDAALHACRAKPVEFGIAGVGAFQARDRPNAVWAAAAPAEPIERLAHKIDRACRTAGAALERRAFVPHITLARLNRTSGPIDPWLTANAALTCPPTSIGRFGLYESRMGHGGSSYHRLADYPLA